MTRNRREADPVVKKRAVDRDRRSTRRPMRLFCALHPTAPEATLLLDPLQALEPLPEHRRTPVAQVHMTALFIGDVDQQDLDEVKKSVERAASGVQPFDWQPDRIETLPARGPVRTIAAVGPSTSTLDELNRRLSQRLARRANRRAFFPHMTLARLKPPKSGFRIEHAIDVAAISFTTVHLMQSWLLPTGAEHQTVLEAPLRG